MSKIICVSAKCSDLFGATLYKNNEGRIGGTLGCYEGYVPDFMPGDHGGDYVELSIDIETGKILNWKKPTAKDLKVFVKP